jgi:hypothetical protein
VLAGGPPRTDFSYDDASAEVQRALSGHIEIAVVEIYSAAGARIATSGATRARFPVDDGVDEGFAYAEVLALQAPAVQAGLESIGRGGAVVMATRHEPWKELYAGVVRDLARLLESRGATLLIVSAGRSDADADTAAAHRAAFSDLASPATVTVVRVITAVEHRMRGRVFYLVRDGGFHLPELSKELDPSSFGNAVFVAGEKGCGVQWECLRELQRRCLHEGQASCLLNVDATVVQVVVEQAVEGNPLWREFMLPGSVAHSSLEKLERLRDSLPVLTADALIDAPHGHTYGIIHLDNVASVCTLKAEADKRMYDGRRCMNQTRARLAAAQALRRGTWRTFLTYVGESKVVPTQAQLDGRRRAGDVLRGYKHVYDLAGGSKFIRLMSHIMSMVNPAFDPSQSVRILWKGGGARGGRAYTPLQGDEFRMAAEAVFSAALYSQVAGGELHGDTTTRGAAGGDYVLPLPTNVVSAGLRDCNPSVRLNSMGTGATGEMTLRDILASGAAACRVDDTRYLLEELVKLSCGDFGYAELLDWTAKRAVRMLDHYRGECNQSTTTACLRDGLLCTVRVSGARCSVFCCCLCVRRY